MARAKQTWNFPCREPSCDFVVNVSGDSLDQRRDNAAPAALRHEDETGHTVSQEPVPYTAPAV